MVQLQRFTFTKNINNNKKLNLQKRKNQKITIRYIQFLDIENRNVKYKDDMFQNMITYCKYLGPNNNIDNNDSLLHWHPTLKKK